MWNPIQYFKIQSSTAKKAAEDTSSDAEELINPELRREIDKAQMRSLKARTEINMLYDLLAHEALMKIKGFDHVSDH